MFYKYLTWQLLNVKGSPTYKDFHDYKRSYNKNNVCKYPSRFYINVNTGTQIIFVDAPHILTEDEKVEILDEINKSLTIVDKNFKTDRFILEHRPVNELLTDEESKYIQHYRFKD